MKRAFLPLVLALLTVPTCASLPAPVLPGETSAALPPFPIAVPSTRGPIPVVLKRHLRRCGSDTTRTYWGCYHYATRTIEIEDSLSLYLKWRTLRHEMVHVALHMKGGALMDENVEDYVAEAVAEQEINAMLMRWPR